MDHLIQHVDISHSYNIIMKYIIYSQKYYLFDCIPVCKDTIYYLIENYEQKYQLTTCTNLRKSYVSELLFSNLKEVYEYIILVYERDSKINQELNNNFEENKHYITNEFYNLWLKKQNSNFSGNNATEFEKFVSLNYPEDIIYPTNAIENITTNHVDYTLDEKGDYFIFRFSDKCYRMYKYTEAAIRFFYFIVENNYHNFITDSDIIKITHMYEELYIYSNTIAGLLNHEAYEPYIKIKSLNYSRLFIYKDGKLIDITEHGDAMISIYENGDVTLNFFELYNMFGDYLYKFLKYLIGSNFLHVDLNDEVVITIYENIDNKKDFFISLLSAHLYDNTSINDTIATNDWFFIDNKLNFQ